MCLALTVKVQDCSSDFFGCGGPAGYRHLVTDLFEHRIEYFYIGPRQAGGVEGGRYGHNSFPERKRATNDTPAEQQVVR
jgi:hypothetical protein